MRRYVCTETITIGTYETLHLPQRKKQIKFQNQQKIDKCDTKSCCKAKVNWMMKEKCTMNSENKKKSYVPYNYKHVDPLREEWGLAADGGY